MINIAIIDDGISDVGFYINSVKEHIIVDNERVIRDASMSINKYSHGSICAAILTKSCAVNIISISMKYDKEIGGYNIKSFITSLELCLTLDIDILHLSIGVMDTSYYYDMLGIINKLSRKGVVIVAAADPTEKLTLPSCYSNVLGVMFSPYVRSPKGFRFINNSISGIDALVNVNEQIITNDGDVVRFSGASSYAVPVICCEISKELSQLKESCIFTDMVTTMIKTENGIRSEKNIDWVNNPLIIIFSQNKSEEIIDDFVIYSEYTVINVNPSCFSEDMPKVLRTLKKAKDVIIVDNLDNEGELIRFFTNFRITLSQKNIALLSDNPYLAEFILSISKKRVYLSINIASKTLIQNSPVTPRRIIKEYKDENELRNILLKNPECLFVSFEKLHILYGIDYIPVELQKDLVLLDKYISYLSYIHGNHNVCIIHRQ